MLRAICESQAGRVLGEGRLPDRLTQYFVLRSGIPSKAPADGLWDAERTLRDSLFSVRELPARRRFRLFWCDRAPLAGARQRMPFDECNVCTDSSSLVSLSLVFDWTSGRAAPPGSAPSS